MSKHTPGAWVDDDFLIMAEDGTQIANVSSIDDFPCIDEDNEPHLVNQIAEECEANVRLIAAAPDLLNALTRIMDGFDAGVWVRSTKDDADPMWAVKIIGHVQALGAAVAAIQKATG